MFFYFKEIKFFQYFSDELIPKIFIDVPNLKVFDKIFQDELYLMASKIAFDNNLSN